MSDRFGEWLVGIAIAMFLLFAILIAPLGSWQIIAVLAYLFAAPVVGGLLYIRMKSKW